jgi:hypothetical protein
LILKIEYLAAKQGKVVIKVNPKYKASKMQKFAGISTNPTEMVKNSSVLNVGITNTQTLAQQKPSKSELWK